MRILILIIGVSFSLAAASSDRVEIAGMQGFGHTEYHLVEAENIDQAYHVFVGLPEGYAAAGDESYPTVYVLDGGALYPLISAYHRYLLAAEDVPKVILVGISYGTGDWQQGNNRSRDYTAATSEREYWGGAGQFQQFLSDELIPMVESTYRSDPDRRIVFGQSLGGQFVLYTAQTRPDLFWGHVASNPALHRNLPFFLEQHAPANSRSRLFVGSGSNDERRFRKPALKWIEHWTAMKSTPWSLRAVTLEGHSHHSAPPAAYRQGMKWLFGD